ncbi:sarcalumenin isoform X3 [Aedes aegypti]|uniref:Dynamin-type G domain-containing protein n=1 Tax=Aedes aegypti TaxID=7159 RepID=A0A6I8U8P6_AEDAE|nr:sarcalumenin isoform X3 [Aedes aegypti]XP_021693370.1 sarcalumenin isoform X3 [Aedes aegypti]XP_021693371.1 sarcalumenin isoform X3 [Aedes aegypti]
MARLSVWVLLGLALFTLSVHDLQVKAEAPTEYECRPYIEKALHELKAGETTSKEEAATEEPSSTESPIDVTSQEEEDNTAAEETSIEQDVPEPEQLTPSEEVQEALFDNSTEQPIEEGSEENAEEDEVTASEEAAAEEEEEEEEEDEEEVDEDAQAYEAATESQEQEAEDDEEEEEDEAAEEVEEDETASAEAEEDEEAEIVDEVEPSAEADTEASQEVVDEASPEAEEEQTTASEEVAEEASVEEEAPAESVEKTISEEATVEEVVSAEEKPAEGVVAESAEEVVVEETVVEESAEEADVASELVEPKEEASEEVVEKVETTPEEAVPASEEAVKVAPEESAEESEPLPEEDLLLEYKIPSNLRDTSHIYELLHINDQSAEKEQALQKVADVILRDLKKIYDTAIKPLENLYKYRDLSNRHFGDPEIFSKPLILFMGPWSGGKSTILNYLTHNEYTPNSVRTGAEPSPAYFNILMHGDEPEVLDGTQLAADWTFSGLQKFGQGLLDRLRGHKLPNKLLERVNIVEIPGILEVRKQVSQYFPFNDACQWFIDRADIIFLVYDPSKLDVGPETEAILDQLKGREYQTRILLNKADQVKPEELLRVQGALIWNISPLMSSAQPPVMYTVSLWSNPYETGAPVRLLQAQERSLLLDLGQAIDKRIENKIASARRFAVRVRNHAKMVDCYLTTYYNHKTLFANKKQISEQIIGNPQQYHIYEGLSTLTNISRYDLPDPDVYRDFFHLNPLYEFQKLSETCTYFRGCPINKLDIAIAYDLPELVGKYKKMAEAALEKLQIPSPTTDFGRGKSSS